MIAGSEMVCARDGIAVKNTAAAAAAITKNLNENLRIGAPIEHRACRGANAAWARADVTFGVLFPSDALANLAVDAGGAGQVGIRRAFSYGSESHFDVRLAAQPFDPVMAGLAHLVHVDALSEFVARVFESRKL